MKLQIRFNEKYWTVKTSKDDISQATQYEIYDQEGNEVEAVTGKILFQGNRVLIVKEDGQVLNLLIGKNGILYEGDYHSVDFPEKRWSSSGALSGSEGVITTKMPGKILKIFCQVGDEISAGDPLLVMEAMKMENEIRSPVSGRVFSIGVSEGDAVEAKAILARIE